MSAYWQTFFSEYFGRRSVGTALLFIFFASVITLHAGYNALAVEGDVVIIVSGKKKALNIGDPVPHGATLITGKDAQAILQWEDTFDLFEVAPETKMKVSGKKIIDLDKKEEVKHVLDEVKDL